MEKMEESWFSGRGQKVSEAQIQTELFYQEKRRKIASLAALDPRSNEYAEAAKEICCCPSAGCIAHGLSTVVIHKPVSKRAKQESWKEKEEFNEFG